MGGAYNSRITIGGVPGAGKSTAARALAERLGYDFWSGGNIRREMAARRGLTIEEFNELDENTDGELDDFQKNDLSKRTEFVLEARLGFHFIPDSFKIYLDCDPLVAAERVYNDPRSSEKEYISVGAVKEGIEKRVANDRERYFRYYGVDCYAPDKFDCVIDTTKLSHEEVVLRIIGELEKKK